MQGVDLGHAVTFNVYVGDVDENGQRVDRQFWYYPEAEPNPVLVSDGGMGGQENMEEESIAIGDGVPITAESQDQIHAFWWEATSKYREFHDKVARGEIEPASTPDGNPPAEEMQVDPVELGQCMNGHGPTTDNERFLREEGFNFDEAPPPPGHPHGIPTIELDIQTFTSLQRQLVIQQFQPMLDLQEMIIETQSIMLRNSLEPGDPQNDILDMWRSKLEEMRLKLDDSPDTETEDDARGN